MPNPANRTPLPPIVSEVQWQAAHQKLLAQEKAATRACDALAAERRQQRRGNTWQHLDVPHVVETPRRVRRRSEGNSCSNGT
jgi:predicted dithiol-disulfide oxidoreductase (DUF899 family)